MRFLTGRDRRRAAWTVMAALAGSFCLAQSGQGIRTGTEGKQSTVANAGAGKSGGAVNVGMKNVDYHLSDSIVLHIERLYGKLTPKAEGTVDFDDQQSFQLYIGSANISLSAAALTDDLNHYVFAKPDAPLKELSVTIKGSELKVKGVLASKGGIAFESTGTLAVTPEGWIRVHTTKVKALHLPVKGLMDLVGLDTADLLNTKKIAGVQADKDDLILDPELILPPPQLHGRLKSVRVENGGVALAFGSEGSEEHHAPMSNSCGARNYIQFSGGSVRFGKLEMTETDMVLMDMQPTDPFDFSIEHYQEQLVAGYAKTTRKGGLCSHMPDYNKVKGHSQPKT